MLGATGYVLVTDGLPGCSPGYRRCGRHTTSCPHETTTLTEPGIGSAVAKAFGQAGCKNIVLVDWDGPGLGRTSDYFARYTPNIQLLIYAVDVSEPGVMHDTVSSVLADPDFGRLDYCINCAGINAIQDGLYSPSPTGTGSAQLDSIDSVNYRATRKANVAYLSAMMQQRPLPSHDGVQARQQRGASTLR